MSESDDDGSASMEDSHTAEEIAASDAKFEELRLSAQKNKRAAPIALRGASAQISVTADPKSSEFKNEKPPFFMSMMAKAKHLDKFGRYADKELNKRFMSGLFVPSIDTEAVGAMVAGVDLDAFAENVSTVDKLEALRVARELRAQQQRKLKDDVLRVDRNGDDWEMLRLRSPQRNPHFAKETRADPTVVFPPSHSLPHLSRRMPTTRESGSVSGSVAGTIGVGEGAFSIRQSSSKSVDGATVGSGAWSDSHAIDAFSRTLEAHEARTVMALPSVHAGVSLTVPAGSVGKYFGKDARAGFFEHYRAMSDANLSFAHVKMGRNDDDQWVNTGPRGTDKDHAADELGQEGVGDGRGVGGTQNEPASPTERSGWDSSLNSAGLAVNLLESPRPTGRAISPSTTHSSLDAARKRSPKLAELKSPLKSSAAITTAKTATSPLAPLPQTSLWASDASAFTTGLSDLDSALLSAPSHQYFDQCTPECLSRFTGGHEATYPASQQFDDTSTVGARSLSRTFGAATMSPLTDRLSELNLPVFSDSSMHSLAANQQPPDVVVSPRSQFLAACIDRGLAPLPSLVMRKMQNTKINLAHFGIGDSMGCAFAECLATLPTIESINLCDNNLTDVSLYPLIMACSQIPGLQELNLSRNKIDDNASAALATYLSSPTCPLYRLVLDAADVDDSECTKFVECLETNKNLCEVDLSHNLLGSAESIPGARTGGAALADYLVSKGCHLKYLKLAWNGIRQASALTFAAAIGRNTTLTFLDLSYNALGSAAGEVIGDSLLNNRTLKTLILDNTNLGSTACVTICIGVCENLAIKRLSLDENPIGEAGAKMVMQVPVLIGNRVEMSASNCNTVLRDASCWYDQANPCRSYSLDLRNPFERAVAFSVLQVVARHSSYLIAKSAFQEDRSNYDVRKGTSVVKKFGPKEDLVLVQGLANDKEDYFDEEQRGIVRGLRTMLEAASNAEKGKKLFQEADLDGGGDLDRDELRAVMERLGLASDPEKMLEMLAVFDLDGTGVMNMRDFLAMLKAQCREAAARVKEMTTYPVLCRKEDAKSHKKYVPPRSGMLHLMVVDGFEEKASFSVLTSTDQSNALSMAMRMGDSQLINEAIRSSKIRYTEAVSLFRRMYKESGNLASSVARLLPQMKTNFEARQLVSKVTGDDRNKVSQIKQVLGIAAKTIFGMYNGYYVLDLSNEYHRVCLSRLFEQSARFNTKRAMDCWLGYGKLGDTSQKGNWSSFRNEMLNKEPIEVKPERFTPMPRSGILEFDFSGAVGPTADDEALADNKLLNVMHNLYLLRSEEEQLEAEALLQRFKRELLFAKPVMKGASRLQQERALRPEGKKSVYECPRDKSIQQGLAGDKFYENLSERRNQVRQFASNECIIVNFVPGEMTAADLLSTMPSNPSPSPAGSPTGASALKPQLAFPIGSSDQQSSSTEQSVAGAPVQTADSANNEGNDEDSVGSFESQEVTQDARQKSIKRVRERLEALVDGPMACRISGEAKAARFCEVVEETFSSIWLNCSQVSLILQKIPFGDLPQTADFGSYVVVLAASLFGRIVDPHNIEIVIRNFSARDAACFYCRIGFLNLFNPAKPEGTLEFDLSRREEAQVARMLIYLSVVEPGNNMPSPRFQWKRELEPTPGFEITAPWATLDGLPKKGNLGITFFSGGGEELEGCKPNSAVRRALMQLVLVDEGAFDKNPLDAEDLAVVDLEEQVVPNSAIKLLKTDAARKLWGSYLLPGCLD